MMRHGSPFSRLLFILLAVVASPGWGQEKADDGAWNLVEDDWYVVEIADHRAGWRHDQLYDDGERYRSVQEQHLTMRRGEQSSTVEVSLEYVESHRGVAERITVSLKFGRTPEVKEWVFQSDTVTEKERQGRRERSRQIPYPEGVWFTPMAERRFVRERMKAGADEIEYRILHLETNLPATTVKRTRAGEAKTEYQGRDIPVTVWDVTRSEPGATAMTMHLSEDYALVYMEEPMGPLTAVTRLATRKEALAPLGRPTGNEGSGPPEVMATLFVVLDGPIPDVASASQAEMRLAVKTGEMPEIPSAGAQRVKKGDDPAGVTLMIDVDDPLPATAEESEDDAYLTDSLMIDSTDAVITRLAERSVRSVGRDPLARAYALRMATHRHIRRKGLASAFATASETVRQRSGDCSEHAVLLCAMLRAQEIPARVATGLIYVDSFAGQNHVFGWHMWTQALVGGKWIDLDATLPQRYHAGHVLVSTSSLNSGSISSELGTMIKLMGNLDIEVIKVQHR